MQPCGRDGRAGGGKRKLMRISLNLATRPFADLGPAMKRLRIAMAVLAVVAVALVFGLRAFDQQAEEARARDHSLDGQIAAINAGTAGL